MDSRGHKPRNCKQGKYVDAGMATSLPTGGNSMEEEILSSVA